MDFEKKYSERKRSGNKNSETENQNQKKTAVAPLYAGR